MIYLKKGDVDSNGTFTIIDEDRLCFSVLNTNRGGKGIRTISKSLLEEFIQWEQQNPNLTAQNARDELTGKTDIDRFEYGYCSTLLSMAKLNNALSFRTPATFATSQISSGYPLQQIYYGAPGTGKSHSINKITQGKNVIRTTFHPDSDYSTFVGAYKPTKLYPRKTLKLDLSFQDLATTLSKYYNDPSIGKVDGLQKFVYEYAPYLNGELQSVNKKQLLKQAGLSENYSEEINKYLKFYDLIPKVKESQITYEFVAQSFTNAYIAAWQAFFEAQADGAGEVEPVFLVIEEINRGNCAQIFGDLFQLLDRNDDGFSTYPIKPDTDLQNYIAGKLSKYHSENYASVTQGEELLLPPNLYIWATMNTSDQSLFPIDSAFKRRWEWKYRPISQGRDESGKPLQWAIVADGRNYDWWQFVQNINKRIYDTTHSEDKKLGFFFCKAKGGKILAETFVEKVIFYLWNDVFKDYGFDDAIFRGADGTELTFDSFYAIGADGEAVANESSVATFLNNLGVTIE